MNKTYSILYTKGALAEWIWKWFVLFLLISLGNSSYSQQDSAVVEPLIDSTESSFSNTVISFTKYKVEHAADSLLFNLIKVVNTTPDQLIGKVQLNYPENWSAKMANQNPEVNLAPGEALIFPVWISVDKNARGNSTYIITASIVDAKRKVLFASSSYVFVPKTSNWKFEIPQDVVYFQSRRNTAITPIRFINEGNSDENLSLQYLMGTKIRLRDFDYPKDETFLELKPGADTTLLVEVKYDNEDFNPQDYKNFRTNSLTLKAQNSKLQTKQVYYLKLGDRFDNDFEMRNKSPLTIQLLGQNVLSPANSLVNVNIFGDLELKNNRELRYTSNIIGIRAGNTIPFGTQLWRFSTYRVDYRDRGFTATLGDQSSGGMAIPAFGRGLSASYEFDNKLKAGAGIVYNMFQPILGYSATVSGRFIKYIGFQAGVSFIDDDFSILRQRGAALSLSIPINKYNSIGLDGAISTRLHDFTSADFLNARLADTTLNGYQYQISHRFNINQFVSTSSYNFSSRYFAGPQNGFQSFNNSLSYRTKKNGSFTLSSLYSDMENLFVVRGAAIFSPRIITWTEQFSYSKSLTPKLRGSIGATYRNNLINTFSQSLNRFFPNRADGLSAFLRVNYKIDGFRAVSLMYERGVIRPLNFYLEPQFANTLTIEDTYSNTRISANYTFKNGGINLVYVEGILVANQIQTLPFFSESRNVFIRPYLTKYYWDKRLKTDFFASYMVQTGGGFENLNISARPELKLGRGWKIMGFANLLLNRRTIDEQNTITTRSVFVNLGIEKRFDIQQPRVKYYDLKLIFFKDKDGDGVRDENEPLLENIVTNISQNRAITYTEKRSFTQIDLISNQYGEIFYHKIPEGSYVIRSFSLVNLKDIYNANGDEQIITVGGNTEIYIPFVESYKVHGKIKLKLQEISQAGNVKLDNVAIVAKNEDNDYFKVLTNTQGEFAMYLPPKPGFYKVMLNNVFGDLFEIEQEEFIVDFNGFKVFEVIFVLKEKPRGVNLNGGYQFKSLTDNTESEEPTEEAAQAEETKTNNQEANETTTLPNKKAEEGGSSNSAGGLTPEQQKMLIDRMNDLQRQIDELKKQPPASGGNANNTPQPLGNSQNQGNINSPTENNMQPYDELGDLINQLIEKTNPNDENVNLNAVSYRVKLGVFKEQIPISQFNKLIELGTVETGKENSDGSSNFISKPFYNLTEAQQYESQLKTQGFDGIKVVGDYAGSEISVEEATKLLEKKNQGTIDF